MFLFGLTHAGRTPLTPSEGSNWRVEIITWHLMWYDVKMLLFSWLTEWTSQTMPCWPTWLLDVTSLRKFDGWCHDSYPSGAALNGETQFIKDSICQYKRCPLEQFFCHKFNLIVFNFCPRNRWIQCTGISTSTKGQIDWTHFCTNSDSGNNMSRYRGKMDWTHFRTNSDSGNTMSWYRVKMDWTHFRTNSDSGNNMSRHRMKMDWTHFRTNSDSGNNMSRYRVKMDWTHFCTNSVWQW
jgi:hypothetical protein